MGMECSFDGTAEIGEMLENLGEKAEAVAAQGLYKGAGVMADTLAKEVSTIRTMPFQFRPNGKGLRMPSPEEKEILMQAGAGIARFDKNGSEVSTSVGFRRAGYAEAPWHSSAKRDMIPIAQLANSINSGTSFMHKQPFFRQAVSKASKPAEGAIVAEMESAIDKITK